MFVIARELFLSILSEKARCFNLHPFYKEMVMNTKLLKNQKDITVLLWPNDRGLKKQVRQYDETFSVWMAIKDIFSVKAK